VSLRVQLPVYSPLPWEAVRAGFRALWHPDAVTAPQVAELIRNRFSPRDLRLTDSGTSALALAIRWSLGSVAANPGQLVAVPAYGCYDLATAVLGAGARAVLYDLDPLTLGPDWDSLRLALKSGPSAVVAVSLWHPLRFRAGRCPGP